MDLIMSALTQGRWKIWTYFLVQAVVTSLGDFTSDSIVQKVGSTKSLSN